MASTIVNKDISKRVVGYMVNTIPSAANNQEIVRLQRGLSEEFGESLWLTPPSTLHVTLMDWLAPLVNYGKDKNKLFMQLFPEYNEVFTKVLERQKPIVVHFNTLKVTPNAIILMGNDDGSFQAIRDSFLRQVTLLPDTKLPPTIIHTTIARYRSIRDIRPIAEFVNMHTVNFDQIVTNFRLVKENIGPMLDYEVIKEYQLRGKL